MMLMTMVMTTWQLYKRTTVILLKSGASAILNGLSNRFHKYVCPFYNTTDSQLSSACVKTPLIMSSSTQVMSWLMSTEP
jgi:hypothetical protein